MQKILLFMMPVLFICLSYSSSGQSAPTSEFTGAEATLQHYKALYILNQSDDKKIRGIIRNISNALEDPRLKGKLDVELVVFGDGVEIYRKANHYDTLLTVLQSKGVILAQCSNTVRERKINKDDLWPFISYVPSGNGEIIIRQSQGWVGVHP